jgi:glutamate-1-semialdehyde aminotransferase/spore coat polysaccharide biosynthesis protein SpsF (cytidylyltransferase family)
LEPQPNVVAIIQARMASTRLPGKVLADIEGRPMLWHIVRRVRRATALNGVLVATSVAEDDDAIVRMCKLYEIPVFRGSHNDVLDRYYQAAKSCNADVVVRITGDCPLIDADVIDTVIETFFKESCDYATNTLRYTYPDGLDTEVFSVEALEIAWREACLPLEREHVTPFLKNAERFRIGSVASQINVAAGSLRWTVDEPSDLEFTRAIYRRFNGQSYFGYTDILRMITETPDILGVNQAIVRNEGYYRSFFKEPPVPPLPRTLEQSRLLKQRAERLIPACTQTFSKGPSQFVQGIAPVFLARGEGSHVWDVDDNEYIDWPMALGPVILGHNYPEVIEAVRRQLRDGVAFSLPHSLEIEVAELLCETIPCAEMVRFGKNGSDVTAAAVRVARAFTGRDLVACCGYHGWQDWYIGTTTRCSGVPKAVRDLTLAFDYNDIDSLKRLFAEYHGQIAAVILEPIGVQEPINAFLQEVQKEAHRGGALLVFDEVVTGFRLAMGGAQQHFGVIPDLACVGKAMGNGFPISAIVGRRDVMQLFDEVFFSFTFGGEAIALAAAKATIRTLRGHNVIARLWEQGKRLQDGYGVLARAHGIDNYTRCVGLPPHTVVVFRDAEGQESLLVKSLFMQECLKRGVLFSGVQNICFRHSPADIDATLRVYNTALAIVADAVKHGTVHQRLEGAPVEPVFRRP